MVMEFTKTAIMADNSYRLIAVGFIDNIIPPPGGFFIFGGPHARNVYDCRSLARASDDINHPCQSA